MDKGCGRLLYVFNCNNVCRNVQLRIFGINNCALPKRTSLRNNNVTRRNLRSGKGIPETFRYIN